MDTMEKDAPAFVGKSIRAARKAKKERKSKRLSRRIAKKEARGNTAGAERLKAKKGVVDAKKAKLQSRDDRREARKDKRAARKVARIKDRKAKGPIGKRIKAGAKKVGKAAGKVAGMTPAGQLAKAAKKAAPKVKAKIEGAKKKVQTAKNKIKAGVKAGVEAAKNTPAVAMYGKDKAPGMYGGDHKGPKMADSKKLTGPGSEGDPGLGRMSMGPGMYGKGSKISYGNYHKPSYAKGGGQTTSGSPFGMNSAQKIHQHSKSNKKK